MLSNRKDRRAAAKQQQASNRIAELLTSALEHIKFNRLDDAEAACRRVLASDPSNSDAWHLIGVAALGQQDFASAAESLKKATARQSNPVAFCNLARALARLDRAQEALVAYDSALRMIPEYGEALLERALLLNRLGDRDAALTGLTKAIAILPRSADALFARGELRRERREFAAALDDFVAALALAPGNINGHFNRGVTLLDLRRYAEALLVFDQLQVGLANSAEFHNARSNTLLMLNRIEESIAGFNRAIALNPDFVVAYVNRGIARFNSVLFEEARADYAVAEALSPGNAQAGWNDALVLLLTGRLAEGFARAEKRWQLNPLGLVDRKLTAPLWTGENIQGQTILVYNDQGFGDAIHFARYVPMLAARGARVLVNVEASLVPLMRTLDGVAGVSSDHEVKESYDVQCSFSTLPFSFGTTAETIPAPASYLSAPPSAVDWGAELGGARPRVGLIWSGNAGHGNDHNRSIPFAMLKPLLSCGARFVSLQKEPRQSDLAALSECREIFRPEAMLHTFADTAGLIEALDLVVTVDTSVAHLAGAMGKPVWIMLPLVPDWRWMMERGDSPWYPSARLFRQDRSRSWDSVVHNVRAALDDFVAARVAR